MTKILIISAAFGLTNELRIDPRLEYRDFQIDVIKYNDNNFYKRTNALHPRLKSKIPKMLGWYYNPGYDYYLWIDSKFIIAHSKFFEVMFEHIGNADLFLFNHPNRTTIESEAKFCSSDSDNYLITRYKDEPMMDQVNHYLADPNFVDDKLFSMGCFLYSQKLVQNPEHNLMTDWFFHNTIWSVQDQLSFPYVLSKHAINYHLYTHNMTITDFIKHAF